MQRATKVSLGLLATWAVSDLEELLTMSGNSTDVLRRLPRSVPIPDELRREGLSPGHVAAAIGIMALVVGAAAAAGVRSGGRSPIFRGALLAFGVHGFGHLATAAALRRYTSGVATAPTMVIPFWLWARRELARDGLADTDRAAVAVAASVAPLTLGVHALVYRVLHR